VVDLGQIHNLKNLSSGSFFKYKKILLIRFVFAGKRCFCCLATPKSRSRTGRAGRLAREGCLPWCKFWHWLCAQLIWAGFKTPSKISPPEFLLKNKDNFLNKEFRFVWHKEIHSPNDKSLGYGFVHPFGMRGLPEGKA